MASLNDSGFALCIFMDWGNFMFSSRPNMTLAPASVGVLRESNDGGPPTGVEDCSEGGEDA